MDKKKRKAPKKEREKDFEEDEWVEKVLPKNTEFEKIKKRDEFDFLFGCEEIKTKNDELKNLAFEREINKNIIKDKSYIEHFDNQSDRMNQSWKSRMETRVNESKKLAPEEKHTPIPLFCENEDQNDNDEIQPHIYQSLETMIEKEKSITSSDMYKNFVQMSQKTYSGIGNVKDLNKRFKSSSKQEKVSIDRIKKQIEINIKDCFYCNIPDEFEAKNVILKTSKYSIILPNNRVISDSEFYIVPLDHSPDSTQIDRETLLDIHSFFQQLTQHLEKENKMPIFLETFHNASNRTHMLIDCFIFDKQIVRELKGYFKKAIQETDVEWAINKKFLQSKGTNYYKIIPAGFPYFVVTFGVEESYIHIIEDIRRVPKTFGLEIIGGYLDSDQTIWLHPKEDSEESISKRGRILMEIIYSLQI